MSLIRLYNKVKGQTGRSGLHETCISLKILEFNMRLAQKKNPNALSKSRPICWLELQLEYETVFALQQRIKFLTRLEAESTLVYLRN